LDWKIEKNAKIVYWMGYCEDILSVKFWSEGIFAFCFVWD